MKKDLHDFNPYLFADSWINDWNNGPDINSVPEHYREDIILTSPYAKEITGSSTIGGKDELQYYWSTAIQKIKIIQFELINVIWDNNKHILIILYMANIDKVLRQYTDMLWIDYTEKIYH